VKIVHRKEDNRLFERELAGIYKFEPISRSHEGFVDILHIGRHDEAGYFYYVMELADDRHSGQNIDPERYVPMTLGRNAREDPKLPIEECLKLGISLTSALSQLHKANLVHRDIKPTNIIVVNGVPKLADIGLVAEIEHAHSFVGTEGFVPQEGPGSRQADVFSLGKVLYEISTGEDRRAFPRIPEGCDNAPFLELNEVIVKACQTEVRDRYQTADEMYADLAVLLNGKSVKRLRHLERRVAWLTRAGVAAAIGVVVLGLAYFQFDRERKHRSEIRQREVGVQTGHGLEALEQGQLMQALPSFVELLRLDTPNRAPLHRTRINMVLQQCPRLVQMWSNANEVVDGQFSKDGRFLALASQTNKVQVVDVKTGQAIGPLFGPPDHTTTVRFSVDGTYVLVGSEDHTATLWDWRTGEQRLRIVDSNMVNAATFNTRGDRIITACRDGAARVWDATSGALLLQLKGHTDEADYAAFSPDDRLIATAGRDSSVLIWNGADGRFLSRRLTHKDWVYYVSFSPDGARLVTACADRAAHVWDLTTDTEMFQPLRHRDVVPSAEFSPDGHWILTGCMDSTARLWDAASGAPASLNPVLRHGNRVLHASFHPDGHRVISTCLDGTSCLWDLAGSSTTPAPRHQLFSPDGNRFLVESNGWAQARQTKGGQAFPLFPLPPAVKEISWSRNGRFLLTLAPMSEPSDTSANELVVRDSETGHPVFSMPSFVGGLANVVVSDDGRRMVWFRGDKARIYQFASGTNSSIPLEHSRAIQGAVFSLDGDTAATINQSFVSVWDSSTGQKRFEVPHPTDVSNARFSQGGGLLITCCRDNTLDACSAQVCDSRTGKPIGAPFNHRDGIYTAELSLKADRVVTASEDSTAMIWDRINGGPPKTLQHGFKVREACFNATGAWVLTVSRDQTARLWDAETGEPISPPLPHPSRLKHGVFMDDQSFLTADDKGESWIWEATTNSWYVQDLMLLGDLLNGKRPSVTGPVGMGEATYAAWLTLAAKHPADFKTTDEHLIAWHRQEAARAEEKNQLSAALFHYHHLLALEPDDQTVIRLRDEAEKRLRAQAAGSFSLRSP